MASNISEVNLYDLLGIRLGADQAEIRKAYRKKALECHPDKNPDNPKAAELFHELSRALEILTDDTARGAYDKVLKAKKAAELRTKELDSKRQKLKVDLEQREKEALSKIQKSGKYTTKKTDEEILQEQLERLRREGCALLAEEQRFMRDQLHRSMSEKKTTPNTSEESTQHRIKLRWKFDKTDTNNNGGYTEEKLRNFLKKYGDIVALVVSKKAGRALAEYKSLEAAEMAINYEKGLLGNPLKIDWVEKPNSNLHPSSKSAPNHRDFEDLVLRQLRQADERKLLIEQMLKEDTQDKNSS